MLLWQEDVPDDADLDVPEVSNDIDEEENDNEEEEEENGIREIEISGDEYSFDPEEISVLPGEEVRIVFSNSGTMSHDLVVEGLDGVATSVIDPDESDIIEFTAPNDESMYPLTYFCSVPGHREAGMVGEIQMTTE